MFRKVALKGIQYKTTDSEVHCMEKEIAAHSSILAWRISWTEEPGGLQSTGSQRVGQNSTASSYSQVSGKPDLS